MRILVALSALFAANMAFGITFVSVCDRSTPVRQAVEEELQLQCSEITEAQLADLDRLQISLTGDVQLVPGDFSGMKLSSGLFLFGDEHGFLNLPRGVFSGLEAGEIELAHLSNLIFEANTFEGAKVDELYIYSVDGLLAPEKAFAGLKLTNFNLEYLNSNARFDLNAFVELTVDKITFGDDSIGNAIPGKLFSGINAGLVDLSALKVEGFAADAFDGATIRRVFLHNSLLTDTQQTELTTRYPNILFAF